MEASSDGLPKSTENSPSTSAEAHRPEADGTDPDDSFSQFLQTGPGTPALHSTSTKHLPMPGSDNFSHKCTSELARGVKRKFDENENEAHGCTRQKTSRYTYNGSSRGVKRKSASDHLEQPRKRFKATHQEAEIEQPEIEKEPSVSNNTSVDERNSVSNIGASDACSENSGDISHSQPEADSSKDISVEEARDARHEQSDDETPCHRSCVCNVGHSSLPEPIEREFPTATPLYRSVLMRRLYSLSNTQYTCCKSRCVRRYPRESVMRVSLRHMTEDYYESDLRVARYPWGEWKQ